MVDRYSVQSFPYAGNIIDHEGMWVTYYDYEALEAKLDALLNGLQVKEIQDLKTKSPEHFAKIAECIADDSQEKAAKIIHLEAKLAALEKLLQEHQTRANYPTKCVDNEESPYSERNMRRHGER